MNNEKELEKAEKKYLDPDNDPQSSCQSKMAGISHQTNVRKSML